MAQNGYSTRRVGQCNTLGYKVYILKDDKPISPFHDIPLFVNEEKTILNMVVEIPRWTNAKMEISKKECFNPIIQDTKKGKLRFVRNCFPHHGYIFNYGALPQTFEDPSHTHPETKAMGDNDPLDVCEIGETVARTGDVKQVKVLGIMALLDDGETDWKIIAVDVNDPLAPKLNDIEDVEKHLPGLVRATNEWFRIYKIPDGKPENQFAFSGEAKNKKFATEIIHECHEAWIKLIYGKPGPGDISLANTTVQGFEGCMDSTKERQKIDSEAENMRKDLEAKDSSLKNFPRDKERPPGIIDKSIDKWFYISGAST